MVSLHGQAHVPKMMIAGKSVVALVLFCFLTHQVKGYPYHLPCARNITAGSMIMGKPVALGSTPVKLAKQGVDVQCGASLVAGETNLTFSWSPAPHQQFLIEAVSSEGTGGGGIQHGTCALQRAVNSVSHKFTVPSSGTITVRAAFSTGYAAGVTVTPDCVYHVHACESGLVPSVVTSASAIAAVRYICTPASLKPRDDVVHCSLDLSWRQLVDAMALGSPRWTTGGLGSLMVTDQWEVWLCDQHAPCLPDGDACVCFVYSEQHQLFLPWGRCEEVFPSSFPAVQAERGGLTSIESANLTAPSNATPPTPAAPPPTQVMSAAANDEVSFDFSGVTKQPHPGSGAEFKTLVYVELNGGLDSAAVMVNVKNPQEVHLWCVYTCVCVCVCVCVCALALLVFFGAVSRLHNMQYAYIRRHNHSGARSAQHYQQRSIVSVSIHLPTAPAPTTN